MAWNVKICSICKEEKPLDEFWFNKKENRYRSYCKKCGTKLSKEWYKNHPKQRKIHSRKQQLIQKYGINYDIYNEMFEKQKGCCSICGKHESGLNRILFVDHDHKTGEVRGLLCQKCNFLLSQAEDNINILKNAIRYVECKI
jgi:hypothetical protein